jgi:hypothetical protein
MSFYAKQQCLRNIFFLHERKLFTHINVKEIVKEIEDKKRGGRNT